MPLVERVILPRDREVGGFAVRRLLPSAGRHTVGPFTFLDHFGPHDLPAGAASDVLPHPHIGLATVTWLFEGALVHRDSLGTVQRIEPGDVNWMSAGAAIAHSERTPPDLRAAGHRLHGLQSWVALPLAQERGPGSFQHCPAARLPVIALDGARLTLIAGRAFGRESPVQVPWPLFYLEARVEPGAEIAFVPEGGARDEVGLYLVDGEVTVDEASYAAPLLLLLSPGAEAKLRSDTGAHLMLLGGQPLPEPRLMFWNFVASSADTIEQAKRDWRAQRFPKIPGEREYIPLPGYQ